MVVRSRAPAIAKMFAFFGLIAVVSTLAIYLVYRPGRPKGAQRTEKPVLSPEITTVVENFRHSQNKDGKPLFLMVANRDQSFSDGHHLLQRVQLEGYGADGKPRTHVSADQCLYDQAKALVRFQKNVVVTSTDGLILKTETLDYYQNDDVVSTDDPLEWEQGSTSGSCVGGWLQDRESHLILRQDVRIRVESKEAKKKDEAPPVLIAAATGEYVKKSQQLHLSGNVTGTRGDDRMKADRVIGLLDDRNNLKQLNTDGNAYLKLASNGDPFEIRSAGMQFFFGNERRLEHAVATGGVRGETLAAPKRTLRGETLEVHFNPSKAQATMQRVRSQGRAVVVLQAPEPTAQAPNPTERQLQADSVELVMNPDGKTTKAAEAIGHALLIVTPTIVSERAERKQLAADRMNGEFFETDNAVRAFSADGHVQSEIRSMAGSRPPRQTWSDRLVAHFDKGSQDVTDMTQEGNFRYREGDRNGLGSRAEYTAADNLIRLRGGGPSVWDGSSRTSAEEIDISTNQTKNYGRRRVRTTYYNRQSTGNAAPFGNTKSPVFVTSNSVEAESNTGFAVYTGNARSWQDNNFVAADILTLYRDERRMTADGHVKSALSNVERAVESGKKEVVPIFADAARMSYNDVKRQVHYETNVHARQGTDALDAQVLDVFLEQDSSRIREMIASRDALYTQPGRRAQGDELTYTAATDKFVLVGNLARVDDVEKGVTVGRQLTFLRSENRVFVEDPRGVQRGRSTHPVQ